MNRKNLTALLIALVCLLALVGNGSAQRTPVPVPAAYAGEPILEHDGAYYFDFGHDRIVYGFGIYGDPEVGYVHTDGTTATLTIYCGEEPDFYDVQLSQVSAQAPLLHSTSLTLNVSADLSGQPDGIYTLLLEQRFCYYADAYLYKQGDAVWVCQRRSERSNAEQELAEIQALQDFVAESGLTPAFCLSCKPDVAAYPCPDLPLLGYRCDTDRWAALAHDIVPHPEKLTKTEIALCLADWMTRNLAYDRFVSDTAHASRDTYYDDYSGKYSVYDLHSGVCRDFAAIYCIMCRELGIPCDTLSTELHIWNILYLDGRWVEIDICLDTRAKIFGEDPVATREEYPYWSSPCVERHTVDFTGIEAHTVLYSHYRFLKNRVAGLLGS